ncbi:MAG: carboxymuconolactone decarboxylase family protein [Actinomycetota bacterium]|nr:carboxymuconolactone decarboxylase family protein [Actinomycetota bacterium]
MYNDIVAHGFGGSQPINFFRALSARTDILEATWALTKAILVNGQLPNSLKQMVALSISRSNECRYCSVVHQGALEAAGVDPSVVETCWSDPEVANLHEPHRSLVSFALKAADHERGLEGTDFESLVDAGMSDAEIAELLMTAGFTNFVNAWADISGIPLDSEG